MKRCLYLIVVFALVCSLMGCGGEPQQEQVQSSAPVDVWPDAPEFTELTEDEFLAAVEKSFISVHAKGGLEFKFFLDLKLNVLAVRAFGDNAHAVIGTTYVTKDLPYGECFDEIYRWAEELGVLGSLNPEPLVVDAVFEMAGGGIKERQSAVLAPFDSEYFMMYFPNQTFNVIEGTITPD